LTEGGQHAVEVLLVGRPAEGPTQQRESQSREVALAVALPDHLVRSARLVLRRHPWAIGLLESRTSPAPSTLQHHDANIGVLGGAGFSVEMTAHAYALIDSYVYGFALQEAALPFERDTVAEVAAPMMELFATGEYPHLIELTTEFVLQPGYDFGNEFDFGLNVILDGLARSLP